MYAGHLSAEPNVAALPDTTVYAHLYFVMIKARRSADKERVMFWFNVRTLSDRFDQHSSLFHRADPAALPLMV